MTSPENIANELKKFSTIVEQSPVVIFTTDLQGNIEYINPFFTKVTGYLREEIIGKNPRILKSGKQSTDFYKTFWQTIALGKIWRGDFCNLNKYGQEYWLASTVSMVMDGDGKGLFYISVSEDITEKRKQNELIAHMAMHDTLTHLPNRFLFMERLTQAIEEAKRESSQLALIYIDVDDFKKINDTMGHACGDEVLKEVSVRLSASIRAMDTAARLGGDEFVIMLKNIQDKAQVTTVAQRVMDAFNQPIKFASCHDEEGPQIGLSIGISLYPFDSQDMTDLLRKADHAMYEAKKNGKNKFTLFQADIDTSASMI